MAQRFDLVVAGGTAVSARGSAAADIGVADGRIAAVGALRAADAAERIDARGLHVLPGVIDSQVHFREPGGEHKEDLESGTRAAALGGVACVFEMPNTDPPTISAAALADKCARAEGRAWTDFAFFVGACAENVDDLAALERLPGCCGVKLFMGSSTGSLLVPDDALLERALQAGARRVAVHAEDEPRLVERRPIAAAAADVAAHPEWRDVETARRATERLMRFALSTGRPVHVLHVTTAEEMEMLAAKPVWASVECTPQHLTLAAPDCYERLGSFAQMNPPVRGAGHRDALWRGVASGVVDVIGSDHAPHTRAEKARPYPDSPSGIPGVQTLLPVMLDHVAAGRLTVERLVDLVAEAPARLYRVRGKGRIAPGFDADLTLVDLGKTRVIEESWLASRCGWSPFAGVEVTGWPRATVVRGRIVMREDRLFGPPGGRAARFDLA